MQYRRVGRSGLKVSELCLGTMTFGQSADEAESARILDAALDAGVTFIDTANTYAGGASEEILGRLLKGRRGDLVLATKFVNATGAGPNDGGASRIHILRAVEDSLRRLRTDHVDLYYVHHVDDETPLDETLGALDDLIRSGKVRYIAASNFEAWRLLEAIWTSDSKDLHRFVAYQPQYNLLIRDIEDEIVPVCELKQVGVVPWAPLAGGLLSGKYVSGVGRLAGTRSADGWAFRDREPFIHASRDAIIATLFEVAAAVGRPPAEVALRWILAKPFIASAIIGVRNLEQARANLAATDWELPAELVARLDAVSAPPPRYPKQSEERVKAKRAEALRPQRSQAS